MIRGKVTPSTITGIAPVKLSIVSKVGIPKQIARSRTMKLVLTATLGHPISKRERNIDQFNNLIPYYFYQTPGAHIKYFEF